MTFISIITGILISVMPATFDHSQFDGILFRNVQNGHVNYKGIKENETEALDEYLKTLANAKPDTFKSDEEKLAFYINAYNAFTIKGILNGGSPQSTIGKGMFFYKDKYSLAGKKISLYDLENKIIRKTFKEPRIHFALVCASKSCPRLASKAYEAGKLDGMLDEGARSFINDNTKNRIDHSSKTVYLSKIFKWYDKDFDADGEVLKFVIKYLNSKDREKVSKGGYTIKYLKYYWSLNGEI